MRRPAAAAVGLIVAILAIVNATRLPYAVIAQTVNPPLGETPASATSPQGENGWTGAISRTDTFSLNSDESYEENGGTNTERYVVTRRESWNYSILGPAPTGERLEVLVAWSHTYQEESYSHTFKRYPVGGHELDPCRGYATEESVLQVSSNASASGVHVFRLTTANNINGGYFTVDLAPAEELPATPYNETLTTNFVLESPCNNETMSDEDTTEIELYTKLIHTSEPHPAPNPNRLEAREFEEHTTSGGGLQTRVTDFSLSRTPLRLGEVELQQRLYPSGAWGSVPTGLVEDNGARIRVNVISTQASGNTASISVFDEVTGALLASEPAFSIPGSSTQTIDLRLGTQGIAWIGNETPRSELRLEVRLFEGQNEVDSRTLSVKVMPKPVLLVHGLWSNPDAWGKYPGFLASAHPNWIGTPVKGMNTGAMTPSGMIAQTNSVAQNAALLGQAIDETRRTYNAWHVDVIAHSMGGIITRKYIQSMPDVFDGKPVIEHLVMLGTPNRGSPCADIVAAVHHEAIGVQVTAIVELMPAAMIAFNILNADRRGVEMSILGSDIAPFTCHELTAGDGVVTLPSAYYTFTNKGYDPVLHTSMTKSEEIFKNFVKPQLHFHSVHGTANGADIVAAEQTQPEGSPATVPPPIIHTEAFTIPARSTHTVTFTVPSAETLGLLVAAQRGISITLLSPAGSDMWTERPGDLEAERLMRAARMSTPAAGVWTLKLRNVQPDPLSAITGAWVEGSGIEIVPVVDTSAAAASEYNATSLPVQVTVRKDNAPLGGQNVTATVINPVGTRRSQMLLDDGAHDDGAANDGVYGGTFTNLPDGVYWLGASMDQGGVAWLGQSGFVLGSEPLPEDDNAMPTVYLPTVTRQ